MNARILVVGAAILSLVGCASRRIPGTDIEDNDDTRAILDVIKKYQNAFEAENADAIVALVTPDFHDDSGTPNPEDDLDQARLAAALQDRFSKAENVRLNVEVRNIEVKDADATAVYYYTLRFETPGLSSQPKTAAELKRMVLKRGDDESWKIVSGI